MGILKFDEKSYKDFYSAEMEVFAVGKWNGDKYTAKDLDEMVKAFNGVKDKWKPPLKIGHGKQLAEQPALGYVDSLKKVGNKLVAKIVNIPKVVKNAIEKGLYKKRSAEIYWDYNDGSKTWKRCLKAVALLGSSIPGVSTLKDVEKFFDEGKGEIKTYEMETKDYTYWSEDPDYIIATVKTADKFRLDTIKTTPFQDKEGVSLITGATREHPEDDSVIQAWQFDRKIWTIGEAQEWLEGRPRVSSFASKPMKTEDGVQYPKEAYLYTPHPNKPSTWKLRIWENPVDKVTKKQLGRAAAAFSPGGFRGEKVQLPSNVVAEVKSKLKALYKKLGAKDDEIPKYLEERRTKMDSIEMMEQKLKDYEDKINDLTAKIAEYEKSKELEKVETLTKELEQKENEVQELKAFKAEAEKIRKERDEAIQEANRLAEERRIESVKAFVSTHGVKGAKKILPRDEQLVTDILLNCPEEKKFKLNDKEASLADMIKEFISNLPELVDLGQKTHKDKEEKEYSSATKEVEAKVAEYRSKHTDITYYEALKTVLDSDPDLKTRYHEERM